MFCGQSEAHCEDPKAEREQRGPSTAGTLGAAGLAAKFERIPFKKKKRKRENNDCLIIQFYLSSHRLHTLSHTRHCHSFKQHVSFRGLGEVHRNFSAASTRGEKKHDNKFNIPSYKRKGRRFSLPFVDFIVN